MTNQRVAGFVLVDLPALGRCGIHVGAAIALRVPDYLTFEQATEGGAVEVQEAAVQSVPTVEARVGPMPVLLLGGDTIIGAMQNRIINLTILLKAAATTAIPVSCLELGRWNSGRHFRASRAVDLGLRRMVAEQVHASRMRAANQNAIWQEIAERQARHSPTDALHDVYAREERDLDAFFRAF